MQPVGTAQTSDNGNRVDCNYGTIDEWFVNGPSGLEQGFNVAPLPQSDATGSLTVELALGGDLTGTVNAAGDGLTLTRPDGSTALGYTGLVAYDATGKTLPASLEVRTEGGRQDLLIHVNTAGARARSRSIPSYRGRSSPRPMAGADDNSDIGFDQRQHGGGRRADATVGNNANRGRPTSSLVRFRLGDPDRQAHRIRRRGGGLFRHSVSISGNTVVVGAGDTVSGNIEQGAAYVFTEPASGWADMTQTAELTASDGQADDGFGTSVSISGNTVVVGRADDNAGARPTCLLSPSPVGPT